MLKYPLCACILHVYMREVTSQPEEYHSLEYTRREPTFLQKMYKNSSKKHISSKLFIANETLIFQFDKILRINRQHSHNPSLKV